MDADVQPVMVAQCLTQQPLGVLGRIGSRQNILDQVLLVLQRHVIQLDEMPLGCSDDQQGQSKHHSPSRQRKEEGEPGRQ